MFRYCKTFDEVTIFDPSHALPDVAFARSTPFSRPPIAAVAPAIFTLQPLPHGGRSSPVTGLEAIERAIFDPKQAVFAPSDGKAGPRPTPIVRIFSVRIVRHDFPPSRAPSPVEPRPLP